MFLFYYLLPSLIIQRSHILFLFREEAVDHILCFMDYNTVLMALMPFPTKFNGIFFSELILLDVLYALDDKNSSQIVYIDDWINIIEETYLMNWNYIQRFSFFFQKTRFFSCAVCFFPVFLIQSVIKHWFFSEIKIILLGVGFNDAFWLC